MEGFAHINGVGLITRATEGKTGKGSPKIGLGILVEWTEKSNTNEGQTFTKRMFINAEMYGSDAEKHRGSNLKGKMIAFDGNITQRDFEDPETGENKMGWILGGFPTLIPFSPGEDSAPAWQSPAGSSARYPAQDFDSPQGPQD